jgi:hypothetical protein
MKFYVTLDLLVINSMKYIIAVAFFFFGIIENQMAQRVGDPVSFIKWKNVVLNNYATFNSFDTLKYGSGFLIKYRNDTIACTLRPDIRGGMPTIKDIGKDLNYWQMYLPHNPAQNVVMDSIFLKYKILKKIYIIFDSDLVLTFSVKNKNNNIIPLEPDNQKIRNKDTLYLIGYDYDHNLHIVQGIVKTINNEKYSEPEIRIKTEIFLNYPNFMGGPIVDRFGKVVGIINRPYRLKIDTKGRIINPDKVAEGSHFEYYAEGISMRSILGKDYPN